MSDDDEFDDLFSFSTVTPNNNASKPSTSTTTNDQFDFDESNTSIDLDAALKEYSTTASSSAHTSDSGSYQKVEDPLSSVQSLSKAGDVDDDEDDIFGDFDVAGGVLPKQTQEDFDEVDEGSREFLDFLNEGGATSRGASQDATVLSSNLLKVKEEEEEEDDDDDKEDDDEDMLDFVDLDATPKASKPKRIVSATSQGSEEENEGMEEPVPDSTSTGDILVESNSAETVVSSPKRDGSKVVTSETQMATVAAVPKPSPATQQSNAILSSDSAESETNKVDMFHPEDLDDVEDLTFDNNLDSTPKQPTEQEVTFDSLADAIRSPLSTMDKHIFPLLYPKGKYSDMGPEITSDDRKWLWTKAVCSKVLTDVESSSLADSFVNWDGRFHMEDFESGKTLYGLEQDFVSKLLEEIDILADRLVVAGCDVKEVNKRNLALLLLFHYRNNSSISDESEDVTADADDTAMDVTQASKSDDDGDGSKETPPATKDVSENAESKPKEKKDIDETKQSSTIEWNSLLGPVAAVLLSASIPVSVASVMLSNLLPVAMPLVSLTSIERASAAKTLHLQFYFLVCYHLPLLVLHLDRYAPGWHWPMTVNENEDKSEEGTDDDLDSTTEMCRNLEANGSIGISWFTSHLAGDTASSMHIEPNKLLSIWDVLLTNNDPSLQFFLALAVMEKHSDTLLMLRGKELVDHLRTIMSLKKTDISFSSFEGDSACDDTLKGNDSFFMKSWCHHTRTIRDSTPISIVNDLCQAEDKALDQALIVRSKLAMEKVKTRLEIEAEEHRQAIEVKNALEEEEFYHQYYKIRLQNFYKKHCPQKLEQVDKILEVYKDRYDELDRNLKLKYSAGFLPAISILNPKLSTKTTNMLSSMGHEIQKKRKERRAIQAENQLKKLADELMESLNKHLVAPKVSANEILPIVCGIQSNKTKMREGLKYYLVDSRPEETVKLQGGFPTAVKLSPEDLMDPDKIQEKLDMFEPLRGAAHICVMGEGFSSFSKLFGHNLSSEQEKLLDDDDSRTNICALFFIKKGFPFVSVLDGGFAAAHTWLARDCPNVSLSSVLVDYDEGESLLSKLENSYQKQQEFSNASTRRKTAIALQNLIDTSMTRLTISESRIEDFTERLRSEEGRKQVKQTVANIFSKNNENGTNAGEESSSDQVDTKSKIEGSAKSFRMQLNGLRRKAEENNQGPDEDQKKDSVTNGKGLRFSSFSFRSESQKDDEEDSEDKNVTKKQNNIFSRIRNEEGAKDEDGKLPQPQTSRPNNIFNRKRNGEGAEDRKAFDVGKISFFANRAERKEEEDLVKEIEASMRQPPQEHEKLKSDKNHKIGESVKKSVTSIKTSMNRIPVKQSVSSIKTSIGNIPFKKIGAMTMRQKNVANDQPLDTEEESVMFDNSTDGEGISAIDVSNEAGEIVPTPETISEKVD